MCSQCENNIDESVCIGNLKTIFAMFYIFLLNIFILNYEIKLWHKHQNDISKVTFLFPRLVRRNLLAFLYAMFESRVSEFFRFRAYDEFKLLVLDITLFYK